MDQAAIYKLIEQYILNRRDAYWLTATSIKPAWRYAFYNPAKKNNEGSIVINRDNTMLIVYAVLISFFTILFVVDAVYKMLYLSAFAFALLIIIKYYYQKKVMIINATGITFDLCTYRWTDYSGAFISFTSLRRNQEVHLILVDSSYRLTPLNITHLGKWNNIGTAIRDFQPVQWKQ